LRYSRLEELADSEFIGTGSGYLVLGNGAAYFLLDIKRISEIIDKSFELSIRKIQIKHDSLGLMLWYAKIRLLNFIHYKSATLEHP